MSRTLALALLFNLKVDASETFNVATNHPAVLGQITAAVEKHKAALKPLPSQLMEVQPLPEK